MSTSLGNGAEEEIVLVVVAKGVKVTVPVTVPDGCWGSLDVKVRVKYQGLPWLYRALKIRLAVCDEDSNGAGVSVQACGGGGWLQR